MPCLPQACLASSQFFPDLDSRLITSGMTDPAVFCPAPVMSCLPQSCFANSQLFSDLDSRLITSGMTDPACSASRQLFPAPLLSFSCKRESRGVCQPKAKMSPLSKAKMSPWEVLEWEVGAPRASWGGLWTTPSPPPPDRRLPTGFTRSREGGQERSRQDRGRVSRRYPWRGPVRLGPGDDRCGEWLEADPPPGGCG